MRLRKYIGAGLITGAVVGSILMVADANTQPVETPTVKVKPVVKEAEVDIPEEPIIDRIELGEFKITAYCPCSACCGDWADGLTYTETVATESRTIAVDPEVIPLGSTVEINGAEYIAEDIGGAIKDNRIDVFFNSHQDALEWGVQYHDIFLIR